MIALAVLVSVLLNPNNCTFPVFAGNLTWISTRPLSVSLIRSKKNENNIRISIICYVKQIVITEIVAFFHRTMIRSTIYWTISQFSEESAHAKKKGTHSYIHTKTHTVQCKMLEFSTHRNDYVCVHHHVSFVGRFWKCRLWCKMH